MTQLEMFLELSLSAVTSQLDRLVAACIDDNGKPKAPDMKTLMQARASLPHTSEMAFKKP